jgi:hypothetical protein
VEYGCFNMVKVVLARTGHLELVFDRKAERMIETVFRESIRIIRTIKPASR